MFSLDDFFRQFAGKSTEQLAKQLDFLVMTFGEKAFAEQLPPLLLEMAKPESSVPASLKPFSQMICDGIAMLMARTSWPRLKKVILKQLQLPADCESGERLLTLARFFPTLQKIAQIVARRPDIDENTRQWLIGLEEERDVKDSGQQKNRLLKWLSANYPDVNFSLTEKIMARASVADVIQYIASPGTDKKQLHGVFKVLKDDIESILKDELVILSEIFQTIEKSRKKYAIENLDMSGIFELVRVDMLREVDLLAEQNHLKEAQYTYREYKNVHIPSLQPYCSSKITAMDYLPGCKITDFAGSPRQRKQLAGLVFEAVICHPIFSSEKTALFHGDPHGGNILAMADVETGSASIALVDWTLAGHLPRSLRIQLTRLLMGIVTENVGVIRQAIELLALKDNVSWKLSGNEKISAALSSLKDEQQHPLEQSFHLLQRFTMDGLLFPAELILFRKAFFTLEGLLKEFVPGFDSGKVLENKVFHLLMQEFPQRIQNYYMLEDDTAESYPSMLTNIDLINLSGHQLNELYESMLSVQAQVNVAQTKLLSDMFKFIHGRSYK